jgi:hypothetical protein
VFDSAEVLALVASLLRIIGFFVYVTATSTRLCQVLSPTKEEVEELLKVRCKKYYACIFCL